MNDLKYRARLSSSVDKGLDVALYNLSVRTRIPLSRLLDDAITAFLLNREVPFEASAPYRKELKGPK